MNTWKNQAYEPLFHRFLKVFKTCHQKEGQDNYPEKFFTSLGNFVLGLGLVLTKKIYKFTYSYYGQLEICSLISLTNKQ